VLAGSLQQAVCLVLCLSSIDRSTSVSVTPPTCYTRAENPRAEPPETRDHAKNGGSVNTHQRGLGKEGTVQSMPNQTICRACLQQKCGQPSPVAAEQTSRTKQQTPAKPDTPKRHCEQCQYTPHRKRCTRDTCFVSRQGDAQDGCCCRPEQNCGVEKRCMLQWACCPPSTLLCISQTASRSRMRTRENCACTHAACSAAASFTWCGQT
jgi:hypothetical protein